MHLKKAYIDTALFQTEKSSIVQQDVVCHKYNFVVVVVVVFMI